MSKIAAIQLAPLQEVRVQALQTLFAALDAIDPVMPIEAHGTRMQGGQTPTAQPLQAVILVPPGNGRVVLAVAGQPLELPLTPELEAAIAREPAMMRAGARVLLQPDIASGVLRLMPQAEAPRMTPATVNALRAFAPGPSTEPAPPLAQVFPPGSPGAAIQRLTGLAFPLAESASDQPVPMIARAGASPAQVGAGASDLPSAIQLVLPRTALPALAALPASVAEAALGAAVRQTPLSPALAQLIAQSPELPGVARLASLRLNAASAPAGDDIERAIRQSGVLLEASLARGQAPAGDLKSLLLALKAAFAGAADPPPQPAKPNAGNGPRAGHDAGVPREPAPMRPSASAPATPSVELARLVEGAVERIKLNQLASLPEITGMRVTDERPQSFHLTTTIPLATHGLDKPQTAAIGLMIEHQPVPLAPDEIDAEDSGGEEAQDFPWKVRIALDLEETGPVQAEIGLRGQAVAVTLWAERRMVAEAARRDIGALHDMLTAAAFEVTRLDVKDGRPVGQQPRATRVLDRRT
jgi:hypothetical protein